MVGGLVALFVGSLLVWAVENRTKMPTEAVIGVVFSRALAVGSMLTSGEELLEALFGAAGHHGGPSRRSLGVAGAALVIVFILRARSRLVIALVSPDLARTAGIDVPRLDLPSCSRSRSPSHSDCGISACSSMGSLIIIPAVTAGYVTRNLRAMQAISVLMAAGAVLAGMLLAPRLGVEPGPLTIVIAAAVFFVSLGLRRLAWA